LSWSIKNGLDWSVRPICAAQPVNKNCHPDGAKRQKDPHQVAPLPAERFSGLMQNYTQRPLSVVEKIDTVPSSLTAFVPLDDNFYLPALMINTKNRL